MSYTIPKENRPKGPKSAAGQIFALALPILLCAIVIAACLALIIFININHGDSWGMMTLALECCAIIPIIVGVFRYHDGDRKDSWL